MKPVLRLIALLIMNTTVVAGLFLLSKSQHTLSGGFNRVYPAHVVEIEKTHKGNFKHAYFAGINDSAVYLGDKLNPLHVFQLDNELNDTANIHLTISPGNNVDQFISPKLSISGNFFYLADGTSAKLYQGHVGDWQAQRILPKSVYFMDVLAVGPASFVTCSIAATNRESIFCKQAGYLSTPLMFSNLLTRQEEGLFSTEGILEFDEKAKRIAFLYSYRNEWLTLDTNLKLLNKARTIDTNSLAKIKVHTDVKTGVSKLASPPLIVNRSCSASNNYLFVQSNAKAENDISNLLAHHTAIDVYDLVTASYRFSFLIPNYDEEKLRAFTVHDQYLFAMFDHHILKYNLISKYFTR